MGARKEAVEHLSEAIQELGRHDAIEVLAEARAEARERVRSILADALAEAMLEHAAEQQLPASHVAAEHRERTPGPPPSPPADRDSDERHTAPVTGAEATWYVYGVLGAQEAPTTTELAELDRESLALVTEDGLMAVTSRVPAEEFTETQLRSHLNDMAWLETVARRHERVLDTLCKRTTVIPMRLCTVYKTEGGVREMLRRESHTLLAALEHLAGKSEWGVKGFFDRQPGSRSGSSEPASSESASGTDYMDQRRRERERAKQVDQEIETAVAEIHERLDSASEESTLNPPQRREVSAHRGEMVLNGAYLVEHENESGFHAETDALQSRFASVGLELVVTGPWPAYNFLPGTIGATW